MGRSYAGIIGLLAFVTVVTRGLIDGASVESTLQVACLSLFGYAAIGYVIGRVGELIVADSVGAKFDAEMKAYQQTRETAASTTASEVQ